MFELATLDATLAAAEAQVPQLRAGCEKAVIWAGEAGQRSDVAVVFLHGFSASRGELSPLPEIVASGLGANLFLTRLDGHGQDGAAMARATFANWQADVDEALQIAQLLGRETLVIGCSTGCTLATIALAQGARMKGLVQVSPNYGLAHRIAQMLLDAPYSRYWGHLIAGRTRRFPVQNDAHVLYWTTTYPTVATAPMGEAVRAARSAALEAITTPTLLAYNPADQVVSARRITQTMARWGGPVTKHLLTQTPMDDTMGHVMAGDAFSPNQTVPLATRITNWFGGL